MSTAVIGRRYAKALFAVAMEKNAVTTYLEELRNLDEASKECPELIPALSAEEFPATQRHNVMEALARPLKIGPTVVDFIKLLIDKRRISGFHDIVTAFQRYVDDSVGVVTATVTTAGAIIDSQVLSGIESEIARLKGRKVRMQTKVNPDLIGGVVVRIGDEIFDGSVAAELKRMKDQLLSA
jgi:F-type H+-transporting ATPase subunit delta